MSDIIDELKDTKDFYYENGATVEQIKNAERTLGLEFAEDYKECLLQYGAVSCGGHEFTGFSSDIGLDVIRVTIENVKRNPNIKESFYVIEEAHIDNIVIWQDKSGLIYEAQGVSSLQKICDSLVQYIQEYCK